MGGCRRLGVPVSDKNAPPISVGEPIRWVLANGGPSMFGTTPARGVSYRVDPLDDVYVASAVHKSSSWGGAPRDVVTPLRHCLSKDDAREACQQAEHRRAWEMLPEPARQLLLANRQRVL